MPATDALRKSALYHPKQTAKYLTRAEPPLTPREREIVKAYGGWTRFMISFGLKPYDLEDIDEAKSIVKAFAADDSG